MFLGYVLFVDSICPLNNIMLLCAYLELLALQNSLTTEEVQSQLSTLSEEVLRIIEIHLSCSLLIYVCVYVCVCVCVCVCARVCTCLCAEAYPGGCSRCLRTHLRLGALALVSTQRNVKNKYPV